MHVYVFTNNFCFSVFLLFAKYLISHPHRSLHVSHERLLSSGTEMTRAVTSETLGEWLLFSKGTIPDLKTVDV